MDGAEALREEYHRYVGTEVASRAPAASLATVIIVTDGLLATSDSQFCPRSVNIVATESYYTCECRARSYPSNLFESLIGFAKENPPCTDCKKRKDLHLVFEFGLGVGRCHCKVLAAFLPQDLCSWKDGNDRVTFYPFLVIVETDDGDRSCWLPYWHIAESQCGNRKTKYGQWAPFMNQAEFRSLLTQARQAGYRLDALP